MSVLKTTMAVAVLVYCLVSTAVAQRRHQTGNTRRQNIGHQQTAHDAAEALRLGLLATQLGVAPVPGAGSSSLTQPPGDGAFIRDDACWCQPINQLCTLLRPTNLDLVTRIINKPGTANPGPSGGSAPNCDPSHQRLCCPQGVSNHNSGNQGFPHTGTSGNFGQCGIRTSYGQQPAHSPTADFGEYPWMAVVLGTGNAYVAGGVLISGSWVLTAAHKLNQLKELSVRLGDYDVSQVNEVPQFSHFEVAVRRVVVHPHFNKDTLANDVALLQLAQPVNFQQYRHVVPACIPSENQLFTGQRCFVTGWGKDAFGPGQYQRYLQEVDVPVIDSFRCELMLRQTRLGGLFNLDKRSFICAGGEQDKDACQGDGGSPLVCGGNGQWTVAGLVAWGVGCARHNVPAAYVNVAAYSNFIRQYIH